MPRALLDGNAAVNKSGTSTGKTLQFANALAHELKKSRHGTDMENQNGNKHLQGNSTQHKAAINSAAIVGKKYGEA
jgi:hypothetical protein